MFEKTLSDLVKGLRSNKRREAEFVSKCIAEIKEELSSKDKSHQVKANAGVCSHCLHSCAPVTTSGVERCLSGCCAGLSRAWTLNPNSPKP